MSKVVLLRLLQTFLLVPPACREWINVLTDASQTKSEIKFMTKVMGFPTRAHADTFINRSIDNPWLVDFGVWSLTIMHLITAVLITWGIIQLVCHIKVSDQQFQTYKTYAQLGLCWGIFFYTFFFGFIASDVFLSYMQGTSFDTSIVAMTAPMGFALLFLNTRFHSNNSALT